MARIDLRLSEYHKNRIKLLADMYAGGSMSLWITYSAMAAPRKFLAKKSDLQDWIMKQKKAPTKKVRARKKSSSKD